MTGSFEWLGLELPWLMPLAVAALLLLWILRRALVARGLYRWVWHPALFDTALYVLLLQALSSATGRLFLP